MNQIKPYAIWIGHAGDARALITLFDAGIRAVVQLAIEEPPIQLPREFIYQRFPLLDGEGNDLALVRLAIEAIVSLIDAQIPTLVSCGAGISRSPAITAAAIATTIDYDLEQSLRLIAQHRAVDVSPTLLRDIKATLKAKG